MFYSYDMEITFGNLNSKISDFKDLIDYCHKMYNRSSAFSRNKKEICKLEITKYNTIKLTLVSKAKLKYPLKALHLFSTLLIKNATVQEQEDILYGKTVLRLLNYAEECLLEEK